MYYLSNWLLFISVVSGINTVQCFFGPKVSRRIYHCKPQDVSPLAARVFGTWTFLSAVIRGMCAYNIQNLAVYQLTMVTFALALLHFGSEWLLFRSTNLRSPGLVSPLIVACKWEFVVNRAKFNLFPYSPTAVSLTWMIKEYPFA